MGGKPSRVLTRPSIHNQHLGDAFWFLRVPPHGWGSASSATPFSFPPIFAQLAALSPERALGGVLGVVRGLNLGQWHVEPAPCLLSPL